MMNASLRAVLCRDDEEHRVGRAHGDPGHVAAVPPQRADLSRRRAALGHCQLPVVGAHHSTLVCANLATRIGCVYVHPPRQLIRAVLHQSSYHGNEHYGFVHAADPSRPLPAAAMTQGRDDLPAPVPHYQNYYDTPGYEQDHYDDAPSTEHEHSHAEPDTSSFTAEEQAISNATGVTDIELIRHAYYVGSRLSLSLSLTFISYTSRLTCMMQDNFCDMNEAINYLLMIQASAGESGAASPAPTTPTASSSSSTSSVSSSTSTTKTKEPTIEAEVPKARPHVFTYDLVPDEPSESTTTTTTTDSQATDASTPATTTEAPPPTGEASSTDAALAATIALGDGDYDAETEAAILSALTADETHSASEGGASTNGTCHARVCACSKING